MEQPIPAPVPIPAPGLVPSPIDLDQKQTQNNINATRNRNSDTMSIDAPMLDTTRKSHKELIIMFIRELMKYLQRSNLTLHDRARDIIRHCSQQNTLGNPEFVPRIHCFQLHLKELVGNLHWSRGEEYLRQFLTQQFMKRENASRALTSTSNGAVLVPFKVAKRKAEVMARSAASAVDQLIKAQQKQDNEVSEGDMARTSGSTTSQRCLRPSQYQRDRKGRSIPTNTNVGPRSK